MKVRTLRRSLLMIAILVLAITAILVVCTSNNGNESAEINMSLFPNSTENRPVESDFVMIGDRLVSYKGTATVIRETDFPYGVQTIGVNAFTRSKVEYVELPQTVKTIEGYSFYACETLKNILIPASCKSVGTSAFNSCYGLEKMMLQIDDPNVFALGVFAFVTHSFDIYVPKDSLESYYNSNKFSSVKENLKTWNVQLTIQDYINGQTYSTEIAYGETVNLPAPNKEGHTFQGLKDYNGKAYETTFRWMHMYDCTLKATWEIEEYEVVYHARDGKEYYLAFNGLSETPAKVTYGQRLPSYIIQDMYEQFRKAGEYLESVKINNISYDDGMKIWDLGENGARYVLDLKFSPKHYNFRFDSTLPDININNLDNLAYGEQIILPTIAAGSKTGYLFDHWQVTNEKYSGDRVIDFTTVEDCDPENNSAYINLWLKAYFNPKTYTVYLNANGGTLKQSKAKAKYDDFLPNIDAPVRSGYRFMGWQYEGKRVDNGRWRIDKDGVTLYAIWEKLYTITLNLNGGQISGESSIEVIYGENFGKKLPTPVRDKHKFLHWTYKGKQVTSNATWDEKNDGVVDAQWEELCRITLNAKGGQVSPAYIDVEKGGTIPTLPVATKAGYEFSGWYLNSIDFDPSNYRITEDITLTTKWWNQVTLTSEESYTVTKDCTYIYLKGFALNLAKPMVIYIDSNVDNVKFTSKGIIVSSKSIIVKSRTRTLTVEFDRYTSIGYPGQAGLDASECPNLNIIARNGATIKGGLSARNDKHGGLVCQNVNIYGESIIFDGGIAGGTDIVEGKGIIDYYNPGCGIYAMGDISVYCNSLSAIGGTYLLTMYRGKDENKGSKIGGCGVYQEGRHSIYIAQNVMMRVEGGKGLTALSTYDGYVSDGGIGINAGVKTTIYGNGSLYINGGKGGDNNDPGYRNGQPGLGGPAISSNVDIDSSVNATLTHGLPGNGPETKEQTVE